MIELFIQKYSPLNTIEKIDNLLYDLEEHSITLSDKVEYEIILAINKLKIQIYLKEQLKIRQEKRIESENVIVPIKKDNHSTFNDDWKEFIETKYAVLEKKKKKKSKVKTCKEVTTIEQDALFYSNKQLSIKELNTIIETQRETLTIQEIIKLINQVTSMNCEKSLKAQYIQHLNSIKEERKLAEILSTNGKNTLKKRQILMSDKVEEPIRATIYSIPAGGQNKRY